MQQFREFRKILYVFLALMMFFSLALTSFACKTSTKTDDIDDEEEDDPTETEEVWEPIKNPDFLDMTDTTETGLYPRTPSSWSFAGDTYSGTTAPITVGTYTRRGIISVNNTTFARDISRFTNANMKSTIDYISTQGDSWTGDSKDDLLMQNPGAPNGAYVEGDDEKTDDKILVIANMKPTASRYASSSISIPANSYAKISVWVNTYAIGSYDLYNGTEPVLDSLGNVRKIYGYADEDGDKYKFDEGEGAVLSLTGGVEEPMVVSGIDTQQEWVEYSFYIAGHSASTKSVTLNLGLGKGSGMNSDNYTEGYAFFDNISVEYYSRINFLKQLGEESLQDSFMKHEDGQSWEDDGKIVYNQVVDITDADEVAENTAFAYLFGLYNVRMVDDDWDVSAIDNPDLNKENTGKIEFIDGLNNIRNDEDLKDLVAEETYPLDSESITAMKTKKDVQYDKFNAVASVGLKDQFVSGGKYRISLWLKTSEFDQSGVQLVLKNLDNDDVTKNYKTITNIDTTDKEFSAEERAEESNSYYKLDNWFLYSFYVDFTDVVIVNGLELSVYLGPDDDTLSGNSGFATYPNKLRQSYVLFSNVEVEKLSSSQFTSAPSSENSVTSIKWAVAKTTSSLNGGFETVTVSNSTNTSKLLPLTTWLVKGNDSNSNYGVMSTKYYQDYLADPTSMLSLYGVDEDTLRKSELRENGGNNVLFMQGDKPYCVYTSTQTMQANSIVAISFWANTLDGASFKATLEDADGNVLVYDETEVLAEGSTETAQEFNEKYEFTGTTSGWQKYTFLVRTGYNTKNFSLRLYNSSNDECVGAVLYDDVTITSNNAFYNSTKDEIDEDYALLRFFDESPYYGQVSYDNTEVAFGTAKQFNYSKVDLKEAVDVKDTEPVEDVEPQETEKSSTFGWVDITFLVIAISLLFAVGAVFVRRINKNIASKQTVVTEKAAYDKTSKAHAKAITKAKQSKPIEKKIVKLDKENTVNYKEYEKFLEDSGELEHADDVDVAQEVAEQLAEETGNEVIEGRVEFVETEQPTTEEPKTENSEENKQE